MKTWIIFEDSRASMHVLLLPLIQGEIKTTIWVVLLYLFFIEKCHFFVVHQISQFIFIDTICDAPNLGQGRRIKLLWAFGVGSVIYRGRIQTCIGLLNTPTGNKNFFPPSYLLYG